MRFDDADFYSDDPFVRYNAHQAAKGRSLMPDPDEVRKRQKEEGRENATSEGDRERQETSE